MSEHGEEICALIVEPKVQGAAGMIVQPEGYLKRLFDICKAHDVLFIADEVATGFGRTGKMFACELEGIEPDLMSLGKCITGGVLPLAATMATQRVYEAFLGGVEECKTFFHGHTYTGNPLACAASLANLELMRSDRLVENMGPSIALMTEALKRMKRLDHVVEVRQQGMMAGIELALDKENDVPYPAKARMGHQAIMAARKRGLIIRPLGDTVILMPPLASSLEELKHLMDGTEAAIREVTES